ncbi:MAG: hypothetical protein IPG61_08255 [bacterium]|nr:hypothetical protein [bacterium]
MSIPKYRQTWTVRIALVALLLGLPAAAWAEFKPCTGYGEAPIQNKKRESIDSAFEAARTAAVRDALELAVRSYVSETTFESQRDVIETRILRAAAGYVEDVRIVGDQNDQNKIYRITITCEVNMDKIREVIKGTGLEDGRVSRRSIMVLVDEYFQADIAPDATPPVKRIVVVNGEIQSEHTEGSSKGNLNVKNTPAEGGSATPSRNGRDGQAGSQAPRTLPAGWTQVTFPRQAPALKEIPEMERLRKFKPASKPGASAEAQTESHFEHSMNAAAFSMKCVEYFPPESVKFRNQDPASAAAISEKLLERDIRLLSSEETIAVREYLIGGEGNLAGQVDNDLNARAFALVAGERYGADAVMVGSTSILYEGVTDDGMHWSTAQLAIKIVDCFSGEILSSTAVQESGTDRTAQGSAFRAATRLGAVAGLRLAEQLHTYFRERDENGVHLVLEIEDVPSPTAKNALVAQLDQTPAVSDVDERKWDRASAHLTVYLTYKGRITMFKRKFQETLGDEPGLPPLEEDSSLFNNIKYVFASRQEGMK